MAAEYKQLLFVEKGKTEKDRSLLSTGPIQITLSHIETLTHRFERLLHSTIVSLSGYVQTLSPSVSYEPSSFHH